VVGSAVGSSVSVVVVGSSVVVEVSDSVEVDELVLSVELEVVVGSSVEEVEVVVGSSVEVVEEEEVVLVLEVTLDEDLVLVSFGTHTVLVDSITTTSVTVSVTTLRGAASRLAMWW
jgi:hypothetical protein